MDSKINPNAIILQTFDLAMSKKVFPLLSPSETLKVIMYVHMKGWLYTPTVDDRVMAAICAYRIKEVNEDTLYEIPQSEGGNILYVPFAISLVDDNLYTIIRDSLNMYIAANPDIEELVLEDKNKKIKRYSLKERHGSKVEEAGITSDANVSN